MRWVLLASAGFATVAVLAILVFLVREAAPLLGAVGPLEFLLGPSWSPASAQPRYGALPLLAGTALVTLGALAVAVPLGLAAAVFLSEVAPQRAALVLKPAIELLAGVPSVLYGFIGLAVVCDGLRVGLGVPSGTSWLAGSLVLGVMALPTIVSVAMDALAAVPRALRESSLALGATRWQTISQAVVPAAASGITAAVVLGMGRALGETMAVMMVTGNAAVIPRPITDVLSPVRTVTGTLGIEMAEVAVGSAHYHALFALALALFAVTLAVNLGAVRVLGGLGAPRSRPSAGRARRWARAAVLATLACSLAAAVGPATTLVAAAALAVLVLAWRRTSPSAAQRVAFAACALAVAAVVLVLGLMVSFVVARGAHALSWEFLTAPPRDLGRAGGIFPAIAGTLLLVGGAILVALPIGVGAGIYLAEYTTEGAATRVIRTGIDLLSSTPSIIFGMFGFAFLVLHLGLGVSLLSGILTLALMVVPTIVRTTEEALKAVPRPLREASLGLGATKLQTIGHVVLPPALPGILTGAVLSVGRAAGETAPVMLTAAVFMQRRLPTSLGQPVMALPYHLFALSTSVPGAGDNAFGTALVLLALVTGIYAVAVFLRERYHAQVYW